MHHIDIINLQIKCIEETRQVTNLLAALTNLSMKMIMIIY